MRHSELGPSKAHRWRRCPGSVAAERPLPDDARIEAAEGQCFHEYADLCLTFGLDPQVFVGAEFEHEKFGTLVFGQEMADNMLYGLDIVRDLAAEPDSQMFVETEVDLSRWLGPGEIGTSDVGVIQRNKRRITIFDWKYGMVPVVAHWNEQAILYALGFWANIAEELFSNVDPAEIEVVIMIEQPRAPGGGGVWRTDMATLLKEGQKLALDAAATREPNAERIPGTKQCQYCRAAKAGTCPEYLTWQMATFDIGLDRMDDLAAADAEPPMPKVITPERRAYILRFAPVFRAFLDQLHADSYDAAMKGHPDPGMKLVPGRSPPRKWKDPEKEISILERVFGEGAYIRKLLSPAQAEERIGKREFKQRFGSHILAEDPKLILVPASDQREAAPDAMSRFDSAMDHD